MQPPAWCAPYIGAPYSDDGKAAGSFNCWTLFAHVQRSVFGTDIADYDGPVWSGPQGRHAVAAAAEAFARRFAQVLPGDEREGDAVLMRLMGHPIHIGVVAGKGWMLHTTHGVDACLERYDGPLWTRRVVGFYRPEGDPPCRPPPSSSSS